MTILRLFRLTEAGVPNRPTKEPKQKKSVFKHANGGAMGGSSDDDSWEDDDERHAAAWGDDEDDLGPEMDYDDPSPDEPEASASHKSEPEPEPAKPASPFASKSQPPSKSLQGGKTADTVKADKETLGALQKALEAVRTRDDDLQDWIDDVIREIGRAVRSGGDLTLPKFEATPSLDDFDDDGGSEDEDY